LPGFFSRLVVYIFAMLGFHRRTRSLIPVKDLAKYDVVPAEDQYEEEEEKELFADEEHQVLDDEAATKSRQRQLLLVYIVVFAEA
jgi:hypothetical protein